MIQYCRLHKGVYVAEKCPKCVAERKEIEALVNQVNNRPEQFVQLKHNRASRRAERKGKRP